MKKLTLVLVALTTSLLHAQRQHDLAVVSVLLRSDGRLSEARVWRRVALDDGLDLVIAMGTPAQYRFEGPMRDGEWWGLQRKLGLFLQDRAQPGRVFTLSLADGIPECEWARIVRATPTDTVISCEAEKSAILPTQKFVYDVRAKRLVSHFSYEPFREFRVRRARANGARLGAANERHEVDVDFLENGTPEFRIVSRVERPLPGPGYFPPVSGPPSPSFGPSGSFRLVEIEAQVECADGEVLVLETRGTGERRYRIPRSGGTQIGPFQLTGHTLWFGKRFYSGEGCDGTGGFGFFDSTLRQYRFFSSPQLSNWSAAAIHVQPEAVWLAVEVNGEYDSFGRGVVRYDRQLRTFKHFAIGVDVGREFVTVGDRLLLATEGGIIVIRGEDVRGFFVDQTTDGRLRVAEGFK